MPHLGGNSTPRALDWRGSEAGQAGAQPEIPLGALRPSFPSAGRSNPWARRSRAAGPAGLGRSRGRTGAGRPWPRGAGSGGRPCGAAGRGRPRGCPPGRGPPPGGELPQPSRRGRPSLATASNRWSRRALPSFPVAIPGRGSIPYCNHHQTYIASTWDRDRVECGD